MKTLCRSGAVSPSCSGEHGKCRATKTNKTNRYEQTEILSATERQRQCRPRRPAHFSDNPEVDAKIDAHIKENPKYWTYVQAMPRERLERTVVLNEVRELDRQQRMREGVDETHRFQPCTQTRLRYAGQRPAGRPEGRRHCPNRPLHKARGCPHARPAAIKRPDGRCLNHTPRPGL